MIQRGLLGQSRALCARTQYSPSVSLKRSPIPPLRILSLQGKIDSRYYSSTGTPGDGASPDGAAVETSQSQIEDTDPIRKDLEVRNKEIIDLKVCPKLKEISVSSAPAT